MSSIYPVSEKASKRLLYLLWFILPIMAVLPKIIAGPKSYNNYLIYKYVFWHSWFQQPMFAFYPDQHLYQNHYGPTFSAVIDHNRMPIASPSLITTRSTPRTSRAFAVIPSRRAEPTKASAASGPGQVISSADDRPGSVNEP